MKNFISIDVEDYHHVFGNYDDVKLHSHLFDEKFSCVEKGCYKFLEKLENKKKKATFFFLGSISNKYKSLIKEIVHNGHEIGSHGFNHIPINLISTNDFKNDLIESKKILEDLSQSELISYRAPGFSLTKNQKQIYNILIENDFKISSSTILKKTDFGGSFGLKNNMYKIFTEKNKFIYEIPVLSYKIFGYNFLFSGGGHLRFTPLKIINFFTNRLNNDKKYVNFYIHPRELVQKHKRIKMNFVRYFKSYYNLKSVDNKIDNILSLYESSSFKDIYLDKDFLNIKNLYL